MCGQVYRSLLIMARRVARGMRRKTSEEDIFKTRRSIYRCDKSAWIVHQQKQ